MVWFRTHFVRCFSLEALPAPCPKQGWGTAWAQLFLPMGRGCAGGLWWQCSGTGWALAARTLAPGWIVCDKSVFVMNFPTCFLFNQCSSLSFGSLCCPLSVPVIFPSQHCHTCFIPSLWECTSSSQFTRNQYIYLRYARKFLFQSIKTLGFTWAITHRLKWKCPEVLLKIEFRKLNFELPLIFCFLLLSSRRKLSKGDSPVFIYCIIIV